MFARFHYSFPNTQHATLNSLLILAKGIHSPIQYAFVRWFKHAPIRGNLLEAAGCVRLVYDTVSSKGTQGLFEVHLSSIVCRHHVVPSFRDKNIQLLCLLLLTCLASLNVSYTL
jgi:hypothetical protein